MADHLASVIMPILAQLESMTTAVQALSTLAGEAPDRSSPESFLRWLEAMNNLQQLYDEELLKSKSLADLASSPVNYKLNIHLVPISTPVRIEFEVFRAKCWSMIAGYWRFVALVSGTRSPEAYRLDIIGLEGVDLMRSLRQIQSEGSQTQEFWPRARALAQDFINCHC